MRACKLSFAAHGRLIGCRAKADAGTFPRMTLDGRDLTEGDMSDVVVRISCDEPTNVTGPIRHL
jgi:hypothetical protein